MLVNFASKPLRHCRAFAGGRDRNLQIAAPHNRSKVEVAMRRIIHAVNENSALDRFAINSRIHFRVVCRGDHNEVAVEICRIEPSLDPFKLTLAGKLPDLRLLPPAQSRASVRR